MVQACQGIPANSVAIKCGIIVVCAEKSFDKFQYLFMLKLFFKLRTFREFPQPDKGY